MQVQKTCHIKIHDCHVRGGVPNSARDPNSAPIFFLII